MKKENVISMIAKNKLTVQIICGVVVAGVIGTAWFLANQKNITFELTDSIIEYGEDSTKIDWLKKANTDAKEVSATIDTKKIGDIDVDFRVCIDNLCDTVIQKVTIKDTKPPEIKVKQDVIEIEQNTDFDVVSNIVSVKDVIDGDILYSNKEVEKDGYYITGDVDVSTPAEYTVKITAIDRNSNKAEKEYKVTIKEIDSINDIGENSSVNNQNNNVNSNSNTKAGEFYFDKSEIIPKDNSTSSGENNNTVNNDGGNQSQQDSEQPTILCANGLDPSLPCDAYIGPTPTSQVFQSKSQADEWASMQTDSNGFNSWDISSTIRNDGIELYYVMRFFNR